MDTHYMSYQMTSFCLKINLKLKLKCLSDELSDLFQLYGIDIHLYLILKAHVFFLSHFVAVPHIVK